MAIEPLSPYGAPPRPLRRDAERNRERLLDAARELLTERGLDVTMDEVAQRAGVGVGTAYRRFASRDELIEALIEERMAEFLALADEVARDADPWNGLITFVERSTAMQIADRGLKDLLMGHAGRLERVRGAREHVIVVVDDLVRRAQAAGQVRPDVRGHDVGMITLMVAAAADFADRARPDVWRRYLALLLDGLRAGCAVPSPLPAEPLTDEELERALGVKRPRRR